MSPSRICPPKMAVGRRFLGIEDARRSGVPTHLGGHGRLLHDASVGREVAAQDAQPALGVVGLVDRAHDHPVCVQSLVRYLAHRHTRDGHDVTVHKASLVELAHDRRDAAGEVEVLHVVLARGRDAHEVRRPGRDRRPVVERDVGVRLVSDGGEVEDRVRGAAERHVERHRVLDRLGGDDLPSGDAAREQVHDPHPRALREADPLGVDRGHGAVAGKAHANGLGEAVHRVRGEQPGARAARGARGLLERAQLLFGDRPRLHATDGREHGVEVDGPAPDPPGEHRSARDDDGRDVEPRCGHEHARDNLVAVRDHHHGVEGVRSRRRARPSRR